MTIVFFACAPKRWRNRATREAYLQILEDLEDPLGVAREWLDVGAGSAVEILAKHLRAAFWKDYGRFGFRCDQDRLALECVRLARRSIDWEQIAERLLARALRPGVERSNVGQGEEGV